MSGVRFNDLVSHLRQVLAELPDRRKGKNLSYAGDASDPGAEQRHQLLSNPKDPQR